MAWQWYDSEIIEIQELTPETRLFVLKVSDETPFTFEAGQFITLDLPIGKKRRDGWRSYSIANAPNDENIVELCIVRLEGGEGTAYLFDETKIGTKITFKGPSGSFVLPTDSSKEIVCICTGTGITPFRGFYQSRVSSFAKASEDESARMHVIFGTRTKDSILFEDEMKELAANTDWFDYDICLSREKAEGYHEGYVHQVYIDQYKGNTKNKLFYICGWSKMIDQAVQHLLIDLKVDRKQIIYELFG